ncbi:MULTISPECIES: efflux RND transporter periplasmic adaptor subunit [unclassified Methylobacterium]|uniref:efflux RND transporter periplasmic adaptor subunit n=1 Tax=unclassified Methylobacterium TaxID=2615210 RepID=UPI0011C1D8AB|nr:MULTISPECIES: efflux RND transporter periplasmic adaptor subunit [unclassified Methylobacterium]QEE39385.1 efflux RND transporter periplasmic adaptor subunit [Methylobacterium sp. WL1]TXN58223.1 efflux RND transporter periplasmic adaptor subunit [Methylobacterium sp. WL2]
MPIAPLLSGPVRVLVVATIAALAAGCRDTNQYVPPPPPSVSVAQPVVRNVTRYFELTGNTKAFAAVDLEARVQGFLEGISYTDGAVVKKGAPLFSIQRNTYEAQLKQAQGALAAQQAALANAQSEYQRQFTLGRQEFASQARVEDAKTKLDQATAAVLEAQANLDIAAINLGYTQVSAPFDGVVTNHLVDVGALVGISGPTKLAQLVRIDPLYIYFNVGEQQVLRVKQHLLATQRTLGDLSKIPVEIGLQDEAGYPHTGKLDYLAPQVDPSTGTLLARALIDNADHALLPGLFVRVRIPVGRDDKALLVRDDAIGTNQQGSYLLTVGADDTVSQRVVTLGPRDGRERVIQTGLKPDEWVVTDGIQRAIPGAKVAPRKVAPADASADPAAIRR